MCGATAGKERRRRSLFASSLFATSKSLQLSRGLISAVPTEPAIGSDITTLRASPVIPCRYPGPRSRFAGLCRPSVGGPRRGRRRGRRSFGRLAPCHRCGAFPVFGQKCRAILRLRECADSAAADRLADRASSCSIARTKPQRRGFRIADQHWRDGWGSGWSKMAARKPTRTVAHQRGGRTCRSSR